MNIFLEANKDHYYYYLQKPMPHGSTRSDVTTCIHDTNPNHNYKILERTLNDVHTECFPEQI